MASVLTAGQNRLIKPGRTVFSRALSASPNLWRDLYTLHPLLEGNKGVSVSLLDWRDVVSGRNPTTFVGTTPTWNLSSPGFVSGNASSGHHRVQFAHGDAIWGNGGSVGSGFMYVNEQGAAIDNGFWSLNGNIDFLVWHDAVDKLTVRISGSVYGAAPGAWPLDSKWHTLSWSLGHGRFRAFVDGAKHLDFASTVSFPTSSSTAYPGYGSDATGRAHTNQYAIAASWSRVLLDQEHRQLAADPFALIRPREVVAIPSAPAATTATVVTQGQNRLIKPGRWAWTPSSLDPWARELAKDTLFLSAFQGTDKAQDLITKEFSAVVPASGWRVTQAGPGASNNGVPEGVAGRWTNNTDRFNPFPYSGGAWPTVQGGAFVMWQHQGQQGNFAAPIAWRNTPTTNGRWNILEDAGGLMYVGFNGVNIVSAIPWLPKTAAVGDMIAMFVSWDGKSRWLFGAANLTKKIRYFEVPTTPSGPTGTTVSNQPLVIGDLPASTNNTQYGTYVLAATFRKWITTPLGNRLFDDPFALIRPRDAVTISSPSSPPSWQDSIFWNFDLSRGG